MRTFAPSLPSQLLEFDDLYKTVGFDDYIGLDE